MKHFIALIYDAYNVLTMVEERATSKQAIMAGTFYCQRHNTWWFNVKEVDDEELEMYKAMINA